MFASDFLRNIRLKMPVPINGLWYLKLHMFFLVSSVCWPFSISSNKIYLNFFSSCFNNQSSNSKKNNQPSFFDRKTSLFLLIEMALQAFYLFIHFSHCNEGFFLHICMLCGCRVYIQHTYTNLAKFQSTADELTALISYLPQIKCKAFKCYPAPMQSLD